LRRITKAALGGVASCALILAASQAANGDSANMTYLLERAPTGDFQKDPGPFDSAEGTLRVSQAPDDAATGFKLTVEKINVEDFQWAAGQEFGAHLHIGPCIDGDYSGPSSGGQAGPHYNHDVAAHGKELPTAAVPSPLNPAEISRNTEVWFDLVPSDNGDATDDTKVNFVPRDSNLVFIPGEMSVVIHVSPTDPTTGGAGKRQACFNLSTPNWAPVIG
jgi:Cu/Zn superoxide dismutase